MTNAPAQKWLSCPVPVVSDTLRWREPLWAAPHKPRGKPDKIGEQIVTAKLIAMGEPAELQVIDVQLLSVMDGIKDAPLRIKKDDMIRRKVSSLQSGDCQKLLQEA